VSVWTNTLVDWDWFEIVGVRGRVVTADVPAVVLVVRGTDRLDEEELFDEE